ncbi:MAG: peptidase M14 [Gammaproteobacteria bacterium]|nr:peptidase M14 [Gammaproteobacteria bacterium]MBU2178345.1 peptidase M14 [Gammaproteobacteria bacterium]
MKKLTLLALTMAVWCSLGIQPAAHAAPILTPAQSLGFELGQWHVRHDQIEKYFRELSQQAPQLTKLEVIGRTHEQRPLLQLTISSAANMAKLEQIRQQHLAGIDNAKASADLPLVIWLGYSIHGNEPSGANSAVKLAHYLLSSDDAEVKNWLDNAIILIQPSLNPDGNDRFALWANMHQGTSAVADPQHREHVEPWPNGRPNHYWFDLNRDWLPLQHPESQARIKQFHHWMPQVLSDFHEMGTNSSFFFQPGIPSRNNPLTPDENYRLTALMAGYHAKAFDEQGKLYYTEENFDDFYIGKGSTYPDVHGSVGILFEQASSRGHLQDSINGPLSFLTTIENQFTMSLSTLRGAVVNKQRLQQWQQQFFRESMQLAKDDPVQGYLLQGDADQSRMNELLQLLNQHQIEIYPVSSDKTTTTEQYFVPLQQKQYRLIKAAFNTATNFRDNTFYDVSAWTLPYAFNIEYSESRKIPAGVSKQRWQEKAIVAPELTAGAYAYALRWTDQKAPVLLQDLLQQGLKVRAATRAFSAQTVEGVQLFAAGTMLIPAGLQTQGWFALLQQAQQKSGLKLDAVTSGLTPMGQDLGSNNMVPVNLPKVLLLAGPGINSTEAGELWFNLERLGGVSPSLAEPSRFGRLDLSKYSHVVLPDGNYQSLKDSELAKLKAWVDAGGVLWAQKSAVSWLVDKGLLQVKLKSVSDLKALIRVEDAHYADKEHLAGQQRIAGAIFQTELDLSHPLTFGLPRQELPVFKNALMVMQVPEQPFVTVARYRKGKQLAGFAAPELVEQISQSAALVAHNYGKGRIIAMTDDPVFRGYFNGSSRLLINALYLGKAFDADVEDNDGEEAH